MYRPRRIRRVCTGQEELAGFVLTGQGGLARFIVIQVRVCTGQEVLAGFVQVKKN